MNKRPSLMDQAGIPADSGAPGKASHSGPSLSPEKLKLAAAVVLLVAAGLVIAWGTGMFRGKPKVDADLQAQREQALEKQLQDEKREEATAPVRRIEAGG